MRMLINDYLEHEGFADTLKSMEEQDQQLRLEVQMT